MVLKILNTTRTRVCTYSDCKVAVDDIVSLHLQHIYNNQTQIQTGSVSKSFLCLDRTDCVSALGLW